MTRSAQLKTALRRQLFVKFTRPFESGSVDGYIMDIGPRFLMVAVVENRYRFNGFQCFRLSDVRNLEVPSEYAAVAEAALRKRRVKMPKKPPVSVATVQDLLISASGAFPLITIHREGVDPDICWIGQVVSVRGGRVSLHEIGADADWNDKPREYRISEITRIDFGGEYEQSLYLVGGAPPKTVKQPTAQRTRRR